MMEQISFTIVMVCLNPGKKLMPTLQSVLGQDYGNFEVIIKDGISIDASLSKIPADSRIRVFSKKDTGIYDAMNQALPYVRGNYVLFLNCGDILHDDRVLSSMAKAIEEVLEKDKESGRYAAREKLRIFYGNQYNRLQESLVCSVPEINDFACYRNVPCHQVCFYDARLFEGRGYLTKYRVRADYEHFLYSIYERHAQAVYVDVVVADYEGGGFSETKENRKCSAREHREITAHYLGKLKSARYGMIMLATLAPLRTKLAEDPRWSFRYNQVKSEIYRRLKK